MESNDQSRLRKKPYYPIAKDGLQILLEIFGFSQDPSVQQRDIVLVSIDFENTGHFKEHVPQDADRQVGIAILDTKKLSSTAPEQLISTYNLITGSSNYHRRAMLKFLFGKPTLIDAVDIIHHLNSLIPRGRKIVLVGHDIRHETHILSRLGFDRQVDISLDTYRIAGQVLPYFMLRLGELLTVLDCPHSWLHNGGNDANFTLKALLLLATRAVKSNPPDAWIDKIHLLERVALTAIPTISPGEKELVEREKAIAAEIRAEKHLDRLESRNQLRLWNIGRQEEIRAERANQQLARGPEATTATSGNVFQEEVKGGIQKRRFRIGDSLL